MMELRGVSMTKLVALNAVPRPGKVGKRPVAIWDLLVWAFAVERVSLDFDELRSASGARPGVGVEWRLMQRYNLGCDVDGGGRSEPHPDADLVASALAVLPEGCGGRRAALWIADLARAGRMPDWGPSMTMRCEPAGWRQCKHGRYAERSLWTGDAHVGRWPSHQLGRDDGYVCRVTYSGSAAEAAARRRAWLGWWGALLDLRVTFQLRRDLTGFEVTDAMPPRTPWAQKS